jgi:hypothetical protein
LKNLSKCFLNFIKKKRSFNTEISQKTPLFKKQLSKKQAQWKSARKYAEIKKKYQQAKNFSDSRLSKLINTKLSKPILSQFYRNHIANLSRDYRNHIAWFFAWLLRTYRTFFPDLPIFFWDFFLRFFLRFFPKFFPTFFPNFFLRFFLTFSEIFSDFFWDFLSNFFWDFLSNFFWDFFPKFFLRF